MYLNIIFDLDGTLIDSSGDILLCLEKSVSKYPEIGSLNLDKSVIGPPLKLIIENLLPGFHKSIKEKIFSSFKEFYFYCDFKMTKLIEGTTTVLSYCSANGIDTFLATNKPLYPTQRILNVLDVNIFKQIVTIDSISYRLLNKSEMVNKIVIDNNLIRENVLFVGDSSTDIYAAKENMIKSVGFLGGYGSADEILSSEPDYTIKSITELLLIINSKEVPYEP